ncbi:uncharacterized protein LOC113914941 [Zalophus californianus]|uniref:Uncharacterized protein LOC113914941 n=1 Tax=Zalophus californianus TaxID=9704 RepID=A0A6J2BZ78_ZALCA|nr:uncharacterized protein LOC113914941 [Zalophus californianus]
MVHEAFCNFELLHCCRPTQGTHPIPTLSTGKQHHPIPPRVSAGRAFPPSRLPTQPNFSGPSATFPGLPGYQKQCFKRMDNLKKIRRRRRKSRVSSQKLAPNLEEKSKGEHCHLENKVWVNFVRRHTNILPQQPQPVRHQAPQQLTVLDGTLPPQITSETTLTSNKGSGLTPRPGFHQAGHDLDPVPGRTKITYHPGPELSAPPRLSSVSTRPGLIPTRGRNPLKEKGAAGIDKFKVCPPAALHPTAFLPDHSPGINCPVPLPLQQRWRDPASSRFCLPPPTQTRTLGLARATQGSALLEVKFPFSSRQLKSGLKGCPPLGYCGNCQRNSPHHTFPKI